MEAIKDDNHGIRVLLLTDSLGCPRKETDVSKVWTDRIIYHYKNQFMFYSICKQGMYFNDVPIDYIKALRPNVIIVQLGVVDACRRVLGVKTESVVRHIPVISDLAKYIFSKYHYVITKCINMHYSSIDQVKKMCNRLFCETDADICFLSIAPGGDIMNQKAYHFSEDVKSYNDAIRSVVNDNKDRATFLDPYDQNEPNSLFLADGHHLNETAHNMVFFKVQHYLESLGGKAL